MKISTTTSFVSTAPGSDRIKPRDLDSKPTSTNKIGFKTYQKIVGWFLSLLGFAVCLKDSKNVIWYVNKKSLIGWTETNGADKAFQLKNLDQLLAKIRSAKATPVKQAIQPELTPVAAPIKPAVEPELTPQVVTPIETAIEPELTPQAVTPVETVIEPQLTPPALKSELTSQDTPIKPAVQPIAETPKELNWKEKLSKSVTEVEDFFKKHLDL